MDNLARNAMLAKQAGMSYGKWKAMQPVVPIVKPEIPGRPKKCEGCEILFSPKRKNQRYHDEFCRRQSAEKRK